MKIRHLLIIVLLFIIPVSYGFGQSELDSLASISVGESDHMKLKQILSENSNWTEIAYYDFQKDSLIYYSHKEDYIFNKKTFIKPQTCNDGSDCSGRGKLRFNKQNSINLRYSRLEQQDYHLVIYTGKYLILESTFYLKKLKSKTIRKKGSTTIKSKTVPDKSRPVTYRYIFENKR